MSGRVLIIGTFDSKADEFAFLRERIIENGCEVIAVNAGVDGSTDLFPIEVEASIVAFEGGEALAALRDLRDRGQAISVMSYGSAVIAKRLFDEGRFDGIIGMGGSGGTGIVTAAMRALPLGVPKVCVSTLAAGDVSPFVGTKDIVMIPSIVDVAGVNRISRTILTRAAGAICGMIAAKIPEATDERPLIAASMFGNTTDCVDACRAALDGHGYETLVFHATGTGGRILESLAAEGLVDAVLDITTTEWADELCGGILSAGPERLDAPGRCGLPHLIVPGCLDMCNFGPMSTVPERHRTANRNFYEWTDAVTLMRTTVEENRQLGEIFARKANAASGPVAFLIPLRGVSVLDGDGELFCDREADAAFTSSLREHLREDIPVVELDANINDPEFAAKAVEMMLELISNRPASP
ncbi:MAG: Tm-1-like ATP-binding domain-containing protein [Planctomycetota bacterium]|nr:Tm-1-like ATP-binding domain-containing protein [Planctomycetota bacterium]MDA1250471.1 Tm-1-like ATP-binding domain-containing protein [Planctomycetota bacterium]